MAVVKEVRSVYSKKSGIKEQNITVLKDATFEEAVTFVKENYGLIFSKDVKEGQIRGFLFPTIIKLIGK